MRNFTLDQYKIMAERFNKMSFYDKIKTLINNTDILILASDGNWWGVKAVDTEIQQQLEEEQCDFRITNEWGSDEIHTLVYLLGLTTTDI